MVKAKKKFSRIAKAPASRNEATRLLIEFLGSRKVIVEGEAKTLGGFDSSKLAFPYDALIRAKSESDVEAVLKLANQYKVPVTARGAGTSLTGSASPLRGGWVLDLSAMKRVAIRKEKMMAVVQPGAVVADIQKAAEAVGLFYPPDPSSLKYCTIGGNIACNAGGLRGAKYGVTRDYVLALDGFLPTGEKVSWGGEYKKFATGYNVRDLWIGSEGTLGIVTQAVLKLVPLPEATATFVVAYANEASALRAVQTLLGRGIVPSILEFLDRRTIFCAEEIGGVKLFKEVSGKPLLLVEIDGSKAEVKALRPRIAEWAKEGGIAFKEGKSKAEAEALWSVRRKCSGAMFALGDAKINEDIVVPLESQVKFAKFLDGLVKRSRLPIATFGHAADGNFHVNIMYYRDVQESRDAAEKAAEELMHKVVALGGTISGEHGIGLAKTPFFRIDRGPAEVAAMRAIKKALDPRGILNPGKLFEVFEVWKHRPVKHRLPWDKEMPTEQRTLPPELLG